MGSKNDRNWSQTSSGLAQRKSKYSIKHIRECLAVKPAKFHIKNTEWKGWDKGSGTFRAGAVADHVPHCVTLLQRREFRHELFIPLALRWKKSQVGDVVWCGLGLSPLRCHVRCYDGMSWDLLWLKVRELSRLPSCCNLACIIPVLLRETGNV